MMWGCLTMLLWAAAVGVVIFCAIVFRTFNGLWFAGAVLFVLGCVAAAKSREVP